MLQTELNVYEGRGHIYSSYSQRLICLVPKYRYKLNKGKMSLTAKWKKSNTKCHLRLSVPAYQMLFGALFNDLIMRKKKN